MSYLGPEKLECPECRAVVEDVGDVDWSAGHVDEDCLFCGARLRLVRRLSVSYEVQKRKRGPGRPRKDAS